MLIQKRVRVRPAFKKPETTIEGWGVSDGHGHLGDGGGGGCWPDGGSIGDDGITIETWPGTVSDETI
ncbi:MAG: hypothetical protein ABA06_00835 [Parcubacteria bacterium C7867-001]|nr:MAG: hypothetical protein ABA06_00835 [Parcubacteria bacterium C7867-001]